MTRPDDRTPIARGLAVLACAVLGAGCIDTATAPGDEDGPATSATTTDASRATSSAAGSSVMSAPDTARTPLGGDASGRGELVRVTDVSDGDTIRVAIGGSTERVRLIGMNAPETGECLADVAGDRLAELVRDAGGEVVLVRDRSDTDRFGRLLRYVESADGTDLGEALVAEGLALARRYPPDEARADRYEVLQTVARDTGIGLWSSTACGPGDGSDAAEVSIRVVLRYDADGDDNQNLNDEWVRFVNEGDGPLDLDGWQVADESASHRYRFRDLVLEPGGEVTVHTGCGTDTADRRYWCNTGSAVWNNSGDTVFLRDPDGNNVVTYPYSRGHPNAS